MNFKLRMTFLSGFIVLFAAISGCTKEQNSQNESEQDRSEASTTIELPGEWYSLEEAQSLAAEDDKKVLVYAEAVWCSYCKRMNSEVFTLKEVQEITEEYFYPVRVDIESEDSLTFRGEQMTEMQFSQGMRVTGTPTFIFFDQEGEIIAAQPGFIPADMYTQILEYVGTDAYLEESFEEFADMDTTGN